MSENINLRFAVLGIILSVLGIIGTSYQIFGQKFLWIILIMVGVTPTFFYLYFYLYKIVNEWRVIVKTFGNRWHLDEGQLIIGDTVNVALRTETIQEVLNAFQRAFPKDYDLILREAGKNAGKSFLNDLKKELTLLGYKKIVKPGKAPDLIREKLILWAKYDSTTGIGVFKVDQVKITVDGIQGHILLENSFLAQDRQTELPTCIFIEGYIEGLINKLTGIDIIVKEVECCAVTGTSWCKFEINQRSRGSGLNLAQTS